MFRPRFDPHLSTDGGSLSLTPNTLSIQSQSMQLRLHRRYGQSVSLDEAQCMSTWGPFQLPSNVPFKRTVKYKRKAEGEKAKKKTDKWAPWVEEREGEASRLRKDGVAHQLRANCPERRTEMHQSFSYRPPQESFNRFGKHFPRSFLAIPRTIIELDLQKVPISYLIWHFFHSLYSSADLFGVNRNSLTLFLIIWDHYWDSGRNLVTLVVLAFSGTELAHHIYSCSTKS